MLVPARTLVEVEVLVAHLQQGLVMVGILEILREAEQESLALGDHSFEVLSWYTRSFSFFDSLWIFLPFRFVLALVLSI
jgi:hypothetical protein